MNDKVILDFLKEKYQQEFEIVYANYILDIDKYNVRASPKENPEIIFSVDYNRKNKHVNDYYLNAIWQYQADKETRAFLDDFEIPYALRVGISSTIDFVPNFIPSYSDLIKDNPDKVSINIFIHLFGNDNAETILPLQRLDQHFRSMDLKKVSFTCSLYQEASLKNESFKDLNFDFGVSGEGTFESENKEHFMGLIKYRIDNKAFEFPSLDKILDIKIDHQNSMKFYSL